MADPRLTQALARAAEGHTGALDQVLPLVYDELRGLASAYMRRQQANHTLQPTALVNEVCARMLGPDAGVPESRGHFFAIAATAMRQVLATHARAKRSAKRQAEGHRVTLQGVPLGEHEDGIDAVDLDDALNELAEIDPRQARLVELRFLSGLTIDETAAAMKLSTATIEREWRVARAWLSTRLREGYGA